MFWFCLGYTFTPATLHKHTHICIYTIDIYAIPKYGMMEGVGEGVRLTQRILVLIGDLKVQGLIPLQGEIKS